MSTSFRGDGQYPGDGGIPLERLWRHSVWKELRGCPGRYVTSSRELRQATPEAIAAIFSPGCPTEHFNVPGKDDIAICRFHGGGGLLTYFKTEDVAQPSLLHASKMRQTIVFVHTLNTESGLLRKIDSIGVPLRVSVLSSPHFSAILRILQFLVDSEKNASAYFLVRRLWRERADPAVVKKVVREIVASVSDDTSRWPFRSERGDLGTVLKALEPANRPELNEVLKSLAAHSIGSSLGVEDEVNDILTAAFRAVRGKAREQLFSFVCEQRLFDLNVWSRCLILHVAQQLNMDHVPVWVVPRLLKSTTRGNLVRLKAEIDSKGNYHSLHKLVYRDVANEEDRRAILQHFHAEAKCFRGCKRGFGRDLCRPMPFFAARPWRKILSDVDDTLQCSAGTYPAGVDKSLPKASIFPGVLGLYRELDLGCCPKGDHWHFKPRPEPAAFLRRDLGNLVFLSARPHVYNDWAERGLYQKFGDLFVEGRMHATPTLLTGDLTSGAEFLRNSDNFPIARKKAERFAEMCALYPEFRHVFVGDNGQGDVSAAEIMMGLVPAPKELAVVTRAALGQPWLERQVDVVYIHRVQADTFGSGDPVRWRSHGIVFIDTFIDAAVHAATTIAFSRDDAVGEVREGCTACEMAHQLSGWSHHRCGGDTASGSMPPANATLILPEGLRRVCVDAVDDFKRLDDPASPNRWTSLGKGMLPGLTRERYRLKLCQSLTAANELLVKRFSLSPVEPPPATAAFALGTLVTIRRDESCGGLAWGRHPTPAVLRGLGGKDGSNADGIVRGFRPTDGVYTVELLGWRLSKGKAVTCHLMLDQLTLATTRKRWESVKKTVKWFVGSSDHTEDDAGGIAQGHDQSRAAAIHEPPTPLRTVQSRLGHIQSSFNKKHQDMFDI